MARIPAISQRFTGAYQATAQARRIAELQAAVDQLRVAQSPDLEAQLEVLREQLQAQSGELAVEVERIYPNPHQPRQGFNRCENS